MVGVKGERLLNDFLGKGWAHTNQKEKMEAQDLLKLKVGSLIKTRAYTGTNGRKFDFGTVVAIHAPRFLSALMHQGMYRGKIIHLRGFDMDQTELIHSSECVPHDDANEKR